MTRLLLAMLAAAFLAGQASAAVFYPAETTVTGEEFGWIHVAGGTGTDDPLSVSVELTVSGSHGLMCDGRSIPVSCSNGFMFMVLDTQFEPLFTLSGGEVFEAYDYGEPIDEVPDQQASKTAVILQTTVGRDFSFGFRFYNQDERLQSVAVAARVFAEPAVAAVPLPAAAGLLASGLFALLAVGRRRRPRGPSDRAHA